jgi:hypothetical protein
LIDFDRAAMSAYDFGDDGEAETSARMTGISASPESLEDTRPVVKRHTRSPL